MSKESVPTIVTGDLCIRPFHSRDHSAFLAAVRESVPSVGRWLPWCREEYSADDAWSWFRHCRRDLAAGVSCDLGLFSRDSGVFLGGIAIHHLIPGHHCGELGYWVRQSQQGKGIAPQAMAAMAEYGFGELSLVRLEIVTARENRAGRRVAEKIGALFEGVARNRLSLHGRVHDAVIYSLIP